MFIHFKDNISDSKCTYNSIQNMYIMYVHVYKLKQFSYA